MKIILITLVFILISGCSTFDNVFPDRSREYEQAETLPDLEIPPDLVAGAMNDSMAIPGEAVRVTPSPRPTVNTTTNTSTPQVTMAPQQAMIQLINNNKPLLAIPEEYTNAWNEVERILQNSEIQINEQDQNTGVFKINYSPDGQTRQRGLFTMIRTWNWRVAGNAQEYQLSLTGVGNKTELVVLDLNGEWISTEESNQLLTTIRDHYNLIRNQ